MAVGSSGLFEPSTCAAWRMPDLAHFGGSFSQGRAVPHCQLKQVTANGQAAGSVVVVEPEGDTAPWLSKAPTAQWRDGKSRYGEGGSRAKDQALVNQPPVHIRPRMPCRTPLTNLLRSVYVTPFLRERLL